MSWVTIDQEKCNGCGMCAKRCPRCYTNTNGRITAQADEECCNLCGHCVALCTTSAITHSRMDMNNFPPLGQPVPLSADEFLRMVRQRRSYRTFRDKAIPREDIEKLVEMSRYCPTGSNMQSVQIKIVTNRDRIKQLSDRTVEFFMEMIDQIHHKIQRLNSEGKVIPPEITERKA
jgi:ferredoxin